MKQDLTELKIYGGTFLTFLSYIISLFSLESVSKFVTIGVGLTVIIYNIYKILAERAKRAFYKRIEKEKKENGKL